MWSTLCGPPLIFFSYSQYQKKNTERWIENAFHHVYMPDMSMRVRLKNFITLASRLIMHLLITVRRHRCPHKPQADIMIKSDQPCTLTEYASKFQKYLNQQRRSSMPPPKKPLTTQDVKMICETTNKKDFVTHPITPPSKRPPVVYQPPEGTVDSDTEYKNNFQGRWAVPAQLVPPPRSPKDNTKPFNSTTTHAVDYSAPPVTPRQIYKSPSVYKPPKDGFEGSSTAQHDFVSYGKMPRTPNFKPPQKVTVSTEPIDGISSYHSAFIAPSMPERFQRPKVIFVPSTKKFSTSTTFKSDFPPHPVYKRSESMRPSQKSIDNADIPLEKDTTNRLSYKTWELPTKFSRPPTVYSPPTEKVSSQTTFKSDYPDYGGVPRINNFKPANEALEQPPFEGVTTQNFDYRIWKDVKKTEPIRQERKYEPPEDRFDGVSTFQAHYKGTYMPRTPSMKPIQKSYTQSSKMDSMTSYRQSFSSSGYKPCPSALLDSKFSYSHEGGGHKFFLPLESSETVVQ